MNDREGGDTQPHRRAVSEGPGPTAPTSTARPTSAPAARSFALRSLIACAILAVGVAFGLQLSRWWGTDDEAALNEARDRLSRAQAALSVAEERNWKYYRENRALQQELAAAREEGTSPPAPPGPADDEGGLDGETGTYGDGVYLVGEDIDPGTYDGVVVGRVGYWARLRNTTGMVDGIIANAVLRGPFVLTIQEGDLAVELQGVRITAR